MIYWKSFADFLAMGGYGVYVWGSFALTAAFMFTEPILVWRRHQRAKAEAALAQAVSAQATQYSKEASK
jgi:heme exporter protein D